MGLCGVIGLKALIQAILRNAPAWIVDQFPCARYAANDGQRIQPVGRPNTLGCGLDRVFGVHAPSGAGSINGRALTVRWEAGDVWCSAHRQALVVDSANVLADYSDGGLVVTGNGQAVLIGTYPGIGPEWGCREGGLMIAQFASRPAVRREPLAGEVDSDSAPAGRVGGHRVTVDGYDAVILKLRGGVLGETTLRQEAEANT